MRPAVAFAANDANGHPRSLAMVGHLAMRPWEIPAAWRFSKNDRLALESLRRVIPIGPDPFAFGALWDALAKRLQRACVPQSRRVVLRRGGDGNTVRRSPRPWLPPQL